MPKDTGGSDDEHTLGASSNIAAKPTPARPRAKSTKGAVDPPAGERKGKRGPSRKSCAECRRLKLKCNGKVPCDQCLKRGYTSICPDGTQQTGQGHKLFWSMNADLRSKLSDMSERIRMLEEALKTAHRLTQAQPHALLAEDLLKIKDFQEQGEASTRGTTPQSPNAAEEPDTGEIVDAFGSLSVSHSGQTKYFGHAANSWWFMHNEEGESAETALDERLQHIAKVLPPEVLSVSGTFPFTLTSHPFAQRPDKFLRLLYNYLPSPEQADHLRDSFFRFAVFMFRPIPPDEYESGVHSVIYSPNPPPDSTEPLALHRLAVCFMVLAIGSLVSPRLAPYNADAEMYHQLARATLFGSRLIESPTIEAIQALHLMFVYMTFNEHSATSNTGNLRWSMAGLVVKLSQTMGLHCDPERFNLEPQEIKRRRLVFCELYTYDIGQALQFSRPPAIAGAYFDVKAHFPEDSSWEKSFHAWKYKFAECLSLVHIQAYSAVPPSYATVLDLNRKLEAFKTFESQLHEKNDPRYTDLCLQRHMSKAIKQEVLLYLHRGFFAKATSEHADDPLKSPYGTSVLAAYRSAYTIVELCRGLLQHIQHPVLRIWFLWSNVFSSAVVLGALVVRCPHLTFAPDAMSQLDSAADLFSRIAIGFSAQKVYEKIQSLQRKARSVLGGHTSQSGRDSDSDDDLLGRLGQRTRVIERPSSQQPSPGRDPVVPLPIPARRASAYHPTVIEYLRQIPPHVVSGVELQTPVEPQGQWSTLPPTPVVPSPSTSVSANGGWGTPPVQQQQQHQHSGLHHGQMPPIQGGQPLTPIEGSSAYNMPQSQSQGHGYGPIGASSSHQHGLVHRTSHGQMYGAHARQESPPSHAPSPSESSTSMHTLASRPSHGSLAQAAHTQNGSTAAHHHHQEGAPVLPPYSTFAVQQEHAQLGVQHIQTHHLGYPADGPYHSTAPVQQGYTYDPRGALQAQQHSQMHQHAHGASQQGHILQMQGQPQLHPYTTQQQVQDWNALMDQMYANPEQVKNNMQ